MNEEKDWTAISEEEVAIIDEVRSNKPLGKKSIYDIADDMGSGESSVTIKTEMLLDKTQQELVENGTYRFMEEGERIQGEIVGETEIENSNYLAVHALDRDRETDHVLMPSDDREHNKGDQIRAELENGQSHTVDYSQGRER